jgi:DNA polymerase
VIPPPPRLADLRAGTVLRAGLGVSTVLPDLDFETYSEAGFVWNGVRWEGIGTKRGISAVGAARYAEHPSTEVLSLAYDLKDGRGGRLWLPWMPPPAELLDYLATGGRIEAWNVGFERLIWERVCVPRMGWPAVAREQWRCAMAKARAFALPGALGKAAEVAGTRVRKDADGDRLLKKFSVPRNPTKAKAALRIRPEDEPLEAARLYAYNLTDIEPEAELSSLTPDLQPDELAWWQVDQEINMRGVQIDMAAVARCRAVVERVLEAGNAELLALTGGAVEAASQVQRLTGWLAGRGVPMASLDEETVEATLKRADLPPDACRALEIRQAVGSASVKKLYAITNQVCADGRLRGLFLYHGARTGRCAGSGPQPTNLPNHGPAVRRCEACGRHYAPVATACPWCLDGTGPVVEWSAAAVEDALEHMPHLGETLSTVSGCLRGLFIAAPGHDLIASDYSAIEAVVLAELAGEAWRREVFRTHGKIYEMSASKITGTPLDAMLAYKKQTGSHHPDRKKGKIAELALGYGGATGALIAFGADEFMTEMEMVALVRAWRAASPAITRFWWAIDDAAKAAVSTPGMAYEVRGMTFLCQGDVLYLRLLSGRYLTYHRPRLSLGQRGMNLTYEGWNTNPKSGPPGWIRMDTYGPKLVENIVQATARDIQRHGLVNQERAGYSIVLHVYDENVAEVPEGWGSVEEFESIMSDMPAWASGWPVRATGGWRGKRYRKD